MNIQAQILGGKDGHDVSSMRRVRYLLSESRKTSSLTTYEKRKSDVGIVQDEQPFPFLSCPDPI